MLDIVRPTKRDCFRAQEHNLAVDELAARFSRSIPDTEAALKAAGMAHSLKPRAIRTEVVEAARSLNRAVILRELRAGRKPQELMAELKINAKHWAGVMYILGINPMAAEPDRLSVDLPNGQTAQPVPAAPAPTVQAEPTPAPEPIVEPITASEPAAEPAAAPEVNPAPAATSKSGLYRSGSDVSREELERALADHQTKPEAYRSLGLEMKTFYQLLDKFGIPHGPLQPKASRAQIEAALRDYPTRAEAAVALGISVGTLYAQIRKQGITPPKPAAAKAAIEPPAPAPEAPPEQPATEAPPEQSVTEAPPAPTLQELRTASPFEELDRWLEAVIAGEPLLEDEHRLAYRLDEFIRGVAGRLMTERARALEESIGRTVADLAERMKDSTVDDRERFIDEMTAALRDARKAYEGKGTTLPIEWVDEIVLPLEGLIQGVIRQAVQPAINELTETVKQLAADVAGHRHQAQMGMYTDVPVRADGKRMGVER
jgi:hypothetical protein